jgi:cell division protein FtsX
MAKRESIVVELEITPAAKPGASRSERVAEIRHASKRAKARVLRQIQGFEKLDPQFEVSGFNNMFPVLTVTTTEAVVRQIRKALRGKPGIKSVSSAPRFAIAAHK